MHPSYKMLHPSWTNKPPTQINGLGVTHDTDSVIATAVHRSIYPADAIVTYFDFNQEWVREDCLHWLCNNEDEIIYMDACMANHKCWGNHPTYMEDESGRIVVNEQSANLNAWVGPERAEDFYRKSHLSTALHILSYYNINIMEKLNEEALAVLAMIDGVHKTFLGNNDEWKEKDKYLIEEILGFRDFTYLFKQWNKMKYFNRLDFKYILYGKIRINPIQHTLETNIRLNMLEELFEPIDLKFEFPSQKFRLAKTFRFEQTYPDSNQIPKKDVIYSNCWNKKNTIWYSTLEIVHI